LHLAKLCHKWRWRKKYSQILKERENELLANSLLKKSGFSFFTDSLIHSFIYCQYWGLNARHCTLSLQPTPQDFCF
jgi:hypothetical protein